MKPSPADEQYMRLACSLALRGRGRTRPNPVVGAVLVKDGRIIGTGYHRKAGSPHAEIEAFQHASEDPERSCLYVTLEPCTHFGKTPPCVPAILSRKIIRVVVGTSDPNPLVHGKGIDQLTRAGVEVTEGVLREECRRLNEIFFKFMETGKPFVTLKAALSLDGKIATATGESRWISCAASRARVHRLRNQVDGILVGIGTVLQDDPQLTARGIKRAVNPLRIVLDHGLRVPLQARVLNGDAPTIIATSSGAPPEKIRALEQRGIRIEEFPPDPEGRIPVEPLLHRLAASVVQHLLVEGGSRVFTSFLEAKEVDRFSLFLAPLLLGGTQAPSLLGGRGADRPAAGIEVYDLRTRKSDRDILIEGRLKRAVPEFG